MDTETITTAASQAAQFINFTGRHVFLTGKAGTGKTTFLRRIIKETHKKAAIVAPTGIAAINAGGVTIHSLFQLPFAAYVPKQVPGSELPQNINFNTPSTLARHLNMNRRRQEVLRGLQLLIIDEVSMLRADVLDAIDFVLRSVRRNNLSFGGLQVLFIGDLYQLSPVVRHEEQTLLAKFYPSAFFFDALCLQNNPPVYVELSHIFRQSEPIFINLLNNLRNNCLTNADRELLEQHYKPDFEPAIEDSYITLTTHNRSADQINTERLKELPGKEQYYRAAVEQDFPESAYPVEPTLSLKINAQVMFIKNDLSAQKRYFNGKIAVVTDLGSDFIEVRPDGDYNSIRLERFTWNNIRYSTHPQTNEVIEELLGTFSHYPIKLAWAITVHKSQGLTFDKAVVDIGKAFAPGQVYVALSRLRSLQGLVLTSYLNQKGLSIDQHVAFFARKKESPEELALRIKQDTLQYIADSILLAFDFNTMERTVYEHYFSYNKDENRSTKQSYLPWAEDLYNTIRTAKAHADKFVKQLNGIFKEPNVDLSYLSQRIAAAIAFFSPILTQQRQSVLAHIEQVKLKDQVKEYLIELLDLEDFIYKQWSEIIRASAVLNSHLTEQILSKEALDDLLQAQLRRQELAKAFTMSNNLVLNRDETKEKPKKSAKPQKEKAPKKERVDTKKLSLEMFLANKSIFEIAKERKMAPTTIEGHLAHYVSRGELDAEQLVERIKLEKIIQTIKKLKTIKSAEIKEALGSNFSYGEIKIALAHFFTLSDSE